LIIDGGGFILPIAGLILHNAKMITVGATWFTILHLPICHEALIIVPLGLMIHKRLFPRDWRTKYRLLRLFVQAKKDYKFTIKKLKKLFKHS